MLPVDENVFQRVSWTSANPNNADTQNRNVYSKSLKRIGKIFKIRNTRLERNKSSGSCSTKSAWEGGVLKEPSQAEKNSTTLNIRRRSEQVKIDCKERRFKSCNLTVLLSVISIDQIILLAGCSYVV